MNILSAFSLNLQTDLEVNYLTKSDFENQLFNKLSEFEASVRNMSNFWQFNLRREIEGTNQPSIDFKTIKNLEKELETLNKVVYRKATIQDLKELKDNFLVSQILFNYSEIK